MEEAVSERHRPEPYALAAGVLGLFVCRYGCWHAFSLLTLTMLTVLAGRLLQGVAAFLWNRLAKNQLVQESLSDLVPPWTVSLAVCNALLIALQLIFDKSGETWRFVSDRSGMLVTAALLIPLVYQVAKPSRSEVAAALNEGKTSYARGSAWLYFLGYLNIAYGDDGSRASRMMDDYVANNEIRSGLYVRRQFLLLPLNGRSMPSDTSFGNNDPRLQEQKARAAARKVNNRQYGESTVYEVKSQVVKKTYLCAIEVASPLRTMLCTAENSNTDLTNQEYEDYCAPQFARSLDEILDQKATLKNQLELVPIRKPDEIADRVLEAIRRLENDGREAVMDAATGLPVGQVAPAPAAGQ